MVVPYIYRAHREAQTHHLIRYPHLITLDLGQLSDQEVIHVDRCSTSRNKAQGLATESRVLYQPQSIIAGRHLFKTYTFSPAQIHWNSLGRGERQDHRICIFKTFPLIMVSIS